MKWPPGPPEAPVADLGPVPEETPNVGATGTVGAGRAIDDAEQAELSVRGMHCAACVSRVERALAGVPGVLEASVNLVDARASLSVSAGGFDPARAVAAVLDAGYEAELRERGGDVIADAAASAEDEDTAREHEYRALIRKVWIGALLTIPIVLIGHAEMIPGLMDLADASLRPLLVLSGLLTVPIMTWVGGGFFTRAWSQLRRGESTMDTLIALGTGSAFLYSVAVLTMPGVFPPGTAHPFFEAAAVVITLVLLGQALEARARGRTSRALRSLLELRPERALRIEGGVEVEVDVADLVVGDVVRVRPGDRVPVDGVVVEGLSAVDESLVTGESNPVAKAPGDEVIGGTVNREGSFELRALRVGSDTVLARIVEQVRAAQGSKPPIQRLADRIAGVFVPAVVAVALLAGLVWLTVGPDPRLNYAVVVAVAVLVISCPCALGLATPISVMIGIGKAAEHGILIRNGAALERARAVDVVVLDKTGTITVGEPEVVAVTPTEGVTEAELLAAAAPLEARSEHPIAQAILAESNARSLPRAAVSEFTNVPGQGVEGVVDGARVVVGTEAFLAGHGVELVDATSVVGELAGRGMTPVIVARDGGVLGVIAVSDRLGPDAAAAVARLRAGGRHVVMLTGDHPAAATAVAQRVGITAVHARVRPDEKAAKIRELQDAGRVVAMVGDGVNDAPALAQADVGIAIGSGTDVAVEAADVTLLGDSLMGVANALELSESTLRNVRQNLFGAFIYNVLAIPVAAGVLFPFFGVLLSPMVAGAAMAFSSVTVVTNANRLRSWQPS